MTLKQFKESRQAQDFKEWLTNYDSPTAPDVAALDRYYWQNIKYKELEPISLNDFLDYAGEEIKALIVNGFYEVAEDGSK